MTRQRNAGRKLEIDCVAQAPCIRRITGVIKWYRTVRGVVQFDELVFGIVPPNSSHRNVLGMIMDFADDDRSHERPAVWPAERGRGLRNEMVLTDTRDEMTECHA